MAGGGTEGRQTIDDKQSTVQEILEMLSDGGVGVRQLAGDIVSDHMMPVWKMKSVAFGDTSPVSCVALADGDVVEDVLVRVTTLFAGGTPAIDIGDDDDDNGFIPNGSITEGTVGWYGMKVQEKGAYLQDLAGTTPESYDGVVKAYTAAKTVKCKLSASLTAGVVEVWVKVSNLMP